MCETNEFRIGNDPTDTEQIIDEIKELRLIVENIEALALETRKTLAVDDG